MPVGGFVVDVGYGDRVVMVPWLDDGDARLHHGDAIDVLRTMPDRSVHMVASSPPFYGLRDYGVDGQIGLEDTPEEWLARLVAVYAECRRVLRDDGVMWVEIGDSYQDKVLLGQPWMLAFALRADGWYLRSEVIWHRPNPMPESVTDRPTKAHSTVFLLSKSSRYFYDADAIREPFSTNTHSRGKGIGVKQETEQNGGTLRGGRNNASFGHATKGDLAPHLVGQPQVETLDGIEGESPRGPDGRRVTTVKGTDASEQHRDGERWPNPGGANARSVWTIPTEPTPFAHFATWPQKLITRMILAGTSARGCCPECGAPWVRDTDRSIENPGNRSTNGTIERTDLQRAFVTRRELLVETIGWSSSCGHHLDPVPCTVLDPFCGSGTTLVAARKHGRHAVGIDLSEEYLRIAAGRLAQQSLLTQTGES